MKSAPRRGTDGAEHMAKKDEQKAEGEAAVVETTDSPLLDLTDAAVKRMIKIAKKRGWVTHDELNAVLPSEEISSDQIEDMNSMLNEMGINVVDNEDAEDAEKLRFNDQAMIAVLVNALQELSAKFDAYVSTHP